MKSLLCVAGCAALASAQPAWFTEVHNHPYKYQSRTEWTSKNIASGTKETHQYYLGDGWFAELDSLQADLTLNRLLLPTGFATGCDPANALDSLKVTLDYIEMPFNGSQSIDTAVCSEEDCAKGAAVEYKGANGHITHCQPARQGEFESNDFNAAPELCVRTGSNTFHEMSHKLKSFNGEPFVRKASGFSQVRWFVRYEVDIPAQCASGDLTLSFSGRTGIPQNHQCVTKEDTREFSPRSTTEKANRTLESATYPLLAKDTHVTTSTVVGAEPVRRILGKAPMIEMTCLDVFFAPQADLPTCGNSEYGLIFNDDHSATDATLSGNRNQVKVTEYHDCSIYTNREVDMSFEAEDYVHQMSMPEHFFQCCPSTTKQQCDRVNEVTDNGASPTCAWVEDRCVPTFDSHTTNLEGLLGENRDVWTYTFSSATANAAASTYYPTEASNAQDLAADNNRLWVIELENNFAGCPQQVDYSYVVAPTSGICEPSTRRMCDAAFEKCNWNLATGEEFATQGLKWYNVFRQDEGNYRTCNCLKRKEVCYRKGGCLSTAKYGLILENCDDAGCGDWCNSAGVAQVSFIAVLVAALALFL